MDTVDNEQTNGKQKKLDKLINKSRRKLEGLNWKAIEVIGGFR